MSVMEYFLATIDNFRNIVDQVEANRNRKQLLDQTNALLQRVKLATEQKQRETKVYFFAVSRQDTKRFRVVCQMNEFVLQTLLDGERDDHIVDLLSLDAKYDRRTEFLDVNPNPKNIARPPWDQRLMQEFPTR